MLASPDENPAGAEPPSLSSLLATRARGASDVRLAGLTAIGGLSLVALAAIRPRWWMYALLPLVAGAFGLWGILERSIAERGAERTTHYDRILSAGQVVAIAIGAIAALVSAFALLGILMGPFIN